MGTFKIGDKSELTSGDVAGTETLLCDTGVVYRKLQISTVASWMGVQAVTASGAATSIDLSLGRFVVLTMEASTTLSFSNVKSPFDEVTIAIIQGGTGSYTVDLPALTRWAGGTPVALSTSVGAIDELFLHTWEGGIWNARLLADMGPAAIAESTVRLATADGEAMFWVEDLDFSNYAGAAGNTPFKVRFTDDVGVEAEGFCGAAGGGLTLGSDIVAGWDFTNGWGTPGTGQIDSSNSFSTGSGGGGGVTRSATFSSNSLTQVQIKGTTTDILSVRPSNSVIGRFFVSTPFDTTQISHFDGSSLYLSLSVSRTATIESLSIKTVTDVPTTGLHLVSALDGSTRNMASAGTGFDPNTIAKIEIFRV